jgi:hypothetical protein
MRWALPAFTEAQVRPEDQGRDWLAEPEDIDPILLDG